jgi:hypothetical protein
MKRATQLLALVAPLALLAGDAFAIIGRPLTPVSFAGVARRTTRRAVYGTAAVGVGAAAGGAATVGAAAYGAAHAMSYLPPGCAVGMPCAGVVYQPVYSGPNVVYVPSY